MPSPEDGGGVRPLSGAQSANSDQTASFEDALAALGETVMRLESGALGLSESIAAYERGVAILRRLHDELAAVEERVKLLVRIDDQGRPILGPVPHDDAASPAATAKQAAKRGASAAKTSRVKTLPGMDDAEGQA
jgi:exodeoxyribonuclease VII small subunit